MGDNWNRKLAQSQNLVLRVRLTLVVNLFSADNLLFWRPRFDPETIIAVYFEVWVIRHWFSFRNS
jgi:hypothetical protein